MYTYTHIWSAAPHYLLSPFSLSFYDPPRGVEIHYPPEIVFSEKGHVAAKVLYQVGFLVNAGI